jgi:hypothetical protein
MDALDFVRLGKLMALTSGSEKVNIALLDGPPLSGPKPGSPSSGRSDSYEQGDRGALDPSALHSYLIRQILSSHDRGIAPGCTLISRHVFDYDETARQSLSTVATVSNAIAECVLAGVHLINLSAALAGSGTRLGLQLEQALTLAAKKGTLIFVAVGGQNNIVSSSLTSHRSVVPVVGYGQSGRPLTLPVTSRSVARRGIGAPGEIIGRDAFGSLHKVSGSSFAVPFVVGTAALLWSLFPSATPNEIAFSLLHTTARRRAAVAPPLLDAWKSYETLLSLRNIGGS